MTEQARGVLFVDVDGTLVGRNGVHARVWPALAQARAAGWRVAICTGRPGRGLALGYAQQADPEGWHVFESGAAVLSGAGAVKHADVLAPSLVQTVTRLGRDHADVEAYSPEGRYFALNDTQAMRDHAALLGVPVCVGELAPDQPVVRVQWVVQKTEWPRLQPLAESIEGITVHVGESPKMPEHCFVALVAAGASKARGAQVVLDHFGVRAEDAAMIGDNLNDLPILELVGRAFVMEDGAAGARALADRLVPSANVGGVADAVADLLASRGSHAS